MGRYKTISDDEVLEAARAAFREKGHTATTREIAQKAGISEAVIYQRFGSKHQLFYAAMTSGAPDLEKLLGPLDPPDDAQTYLQTVVARLGEYFAEIIPLAVRLMTHPSFSPLAMGHMRSRRPATIIQQGLAERLASLVTRKRIQTASVDVTARLLVSIAHDWALGTVFTGTVPPPTRRDRELGELVDVVWAGLHSRKS